MFPQERRNQIVKMLKHNRSLSVRELCDLLEASEATIRRDLTLLEQQGILERTHGGAIISDEISVLEEPSFSQKESEYHEEKIRIAMYAFKLLNENDTLFLDAGTTTIELAKIIGESNISLTVISNSVTAVPYLARNDRVKIYSLGGEIRNNTLAVVGQMALDAISRFNPNKAFIGVNGISIEKGLTTHYTAEAEVKQAMMRYASEVIVLADHSKFKQVTLCKFASLSMVDLIITDAALPPHIEQSFNQYEDLKIVKV